MQSCKHSSTGKLYVESAATSGMLQMVTSRVQGQKPTPGVRRARLQARAVAGRRLARARKVWASKVSGFTMAVATQLGQTPLEMAAVLPRTLEDYVRRMQGLSRFSAANRELLDLEPLVLKYFNMLYLHGHQAEEGGKLLAALQHFAPGLRRSPTMARAWRAVRGWKKLMPVVSRVPLHLPALFCIRGSGIWMGAMEKTVAVLLMLA